MKTFNKIFKLKLRARMLMALCTAVLLSAFSIQSSAQAAATIPSIDKSALVIHGNARDGSPDRVMNNHRVAVHKHIAAKIAKHEKRAGKKGSHGRRHKENHPGKKHVRLGKKATSRHRVGFHHN
jgi:hypothetical protein